VSGARPAGCAARRLGACPVCGGGSLVPLPAPADWIGEVVFAACRGRLGLSRCRGCGLVFTNPRPPERLLEEFYAGADYEPHHRGLDAVLAAKYRFLLGLLAAHPGGRAPGRLLDYGCGSGALVEFAAARGWRAQGYEPSRRAVDAGRARGLDLTADPAELPAGGFDVVFSHHVIEHLPRPVEAVSRLRGWLRPGGLLLAATPNAASLRARLSAPWLPRRLGLENRYHSYPIHLLYFSGPSLAGCLERAGLAVREVTTYGLGLDSLRRRPAAPAPAAAAPAHPPTCPDGPPPAPAGWKAPLKRWFFGLGWGENLAAVARRPPV
jgi:SAM-dependent methyltransferase